MPSSVGHPSANLNVFIPNSSLARSILAAMNHIAFEELAFYSEVERLYDL